MAVRKGITDILVKNHNYHVRYGSRQNDFYIYRPVEEEGQSRTDGSLLIARAMPALMAHVQKPEREAILQECKAGVPYFDAVLAEVLYRQARRLSRPRTSYSTKLPKHIIDWDQPLLFEKRKRKKAKSYAEMESQRYHEAEKQRQRERIARKKMEREREKKAQELARAARERERHERRRLKEMAEAAKRREREERRRLKAMERTNRVNAMKGYVPRSAYGSDYPKSYGVVEYRDLAPTTSARTTSRTVENDDVDVEVSRLPDIVSIAQFLWAAAPALYIEETSVRLGALERGIASVRDEGATTSFFDTVMSRLVCKPLALRRFSSAITRRVILPRSWWEPRLQHVVNNWFERLDAVKLFLRAKRATSIVVNDDVDRAAAKKKKRSKRKMTVPQMRDVLRQNGWGIEDKGNSHYVYMAPSKRSMFTSILSAMEHHRKSTRGDDTKETTDPLPPSTVEDVEQNDKLEESAPSYLSCRFMCGFRCEAKRKNDVLLAHEFACPLALPRAGVVVAETALDAHRTWLSTDQQNEGHVVNIVREGSRFDCVVVREVVRGLLYSVVMLGDRSVENVVPITRIVPLPTSRTSTIPIHLDRKMFVDVKSHPKQGDVERALRRLINNANDAQSYRLILSKMSVAALDEERQYLEALASMSNGGCLDPVTSFETSPFKSSSTTFRELDIPSRAGIVLALCHFRLDQSQTIYHQINRVEDSLHRSLPLTLDVDDRDQTRTRILWHFPHFTDGHTRLYSSESFSSSRWTLLCHDRESLARLADARAKKAASTFFANNKKSSKRVRRVSKMLNQIRNDAESAELAAEALVNQAEMASLKLRSESLSEFRTRVTTMIEDDDVCDDPERLEPISDAACALCQLDSTTSRLVTCDKRGCNLCFHVRCLGLIQGDEAKKKGDSIGNNIFVSSLDTKPWFCPECRDASSSANFNFTRSGRRRRRRRCGECAGCRRPSCGTCQNCRVNQTCSKRVCSNMQFCEPAKPIEFVEGWRKSARLRSKPKVSYAIDDGIDDDVQWEEKSFTASKRRRVQSKTLTTRANGRNVVRRNGDPFVGSQIARMFNNKIYVATVTRYIPPRDDFENPVWLVRHEDGDEENLEKDEIEEGIRMWKTAGATNGSSHVKSIVNRRTIRPRSARFVWNDRNESSGPLRIQLPYGI